MALCKILYTIYGRDTRSAQVVNILLSGLWAFLLWLHYRGVLRLDIPTVVAQGVVETMVIAILAAMFSLVGLLTKGKRHQLFKFFGLSLGAIFYSVLANGYFSAYPPLEMMLVVSVSLAIWFTGGLLYIAKCEGLDDSFNEL